MFRLIDDFRSCDENAQPYSFSVERHTETANLHARVWNDCFDLASVGNRHILNAPAHSEGTFEMLFHFTYMEEIPPWFTVFFHYDAQARRGRCLRFRYFLDGRVRITLLSVDKTRFTEIGGAEEDLPELLTEKEFAPLILTIGGGKVSGTFAGVPFAFPAGNGRGKLAIERGDFIGELLVGRISFRTEEEFPRTVLLPPAKAEIPLTNGGDIPYTLSFGVERIGDIAYFSASLDGGTKTRPVMREDRPGQYVAEKDWMTGPYTGLIRGDARCVFWFAKGERCFIDPNIFWECQKRFFGDTTLPLTVYAPVPENMIASDTEVLFGYEDLMCTGYASQAGGSEFRFAKDGILLSEGAPEDGRDAFALYSQPDKYALSFVPEDIWHREEVISHIRYNHYFDAAEDMDFVMEMKTKTDPAYLSVRVSVMDAFERKTLGTYETQTMCREGRAGYHLLSVRTHVPHMAVGVYKIVFSVFFGDRQYKRFVKVFEVYDRNTDENPALATGLPFTFSMPNEQKWLMRNSFDLWNPARSCDVEHFITCITETPVEAEIRRSWRMIHAFKREWFAWVSSRTCRNWRIESHPEVAEHADYLFASWDERKVDLSQSGLYPVRQDHFNYENFMWRREVRLAILSDFLAEHPDIAARISWRPGEDFTPAHFEELWQICPREWVAYQNERGMDILRDYNEELRKYNPATKRAIYGPVSVYVTPTLTWQSLRAYGFPDGKRLVSDCYTGFCIFEDYPYSCGYPTYRGAFTAMQILLACPGLTLYLEQYKGSRGGCIDGAVKFAHAPMGEFKSEPYENSTHAFEYVFNTPYLRPDGFHYWDTYGFHRNDYRSEFMDRLIRDWYYVLRNKPARPLRTMAFISEYTDEEDAFTVFRRDEKTARRVLINRTEAGHGLVHECSREAGLPGGFALRFDALDRLTEKDCDLLVLPSLALADEKQKKKIRRLYEAGVNLLAVSSVEGLEDLFGVAREESETEITCVRYGTESEYVLGIPATLLYRKGGAAVLMESDRGEPLLFSTGRTLLVNAPVTSLGAEDSPALAHCKAPHITGRLIRKALSEALQTLCRPLAQGEEHVAVTLFETGSGKRETGRGRRELLVIDYTPWDNKEHTRREAVVRLNMPDVRGVHSERELFVGRKDGAVREIRFDILPHESVFIDLDDMPETGTDRWS